MSFVFGPSWFYGLDSGFGVLEMLITLVISVYTFRIYLLTRLRKYLYFTLAFLLISGSLAVRAAGDYVVYTSLIGHVPNLVAAVNTVTSIPVLYSLGIIAFMVSGFAGYLILLAIFLRIDSFRSVTLLFILAILIAVFSTDKFVAYHLTMLLMLLLIVIHLLANHLRKRKLGSFLVLYSMSSLLAAQVFFFLMGRGSLFYIGGHTLQLFGFFLLLINLVMVLRK
jgi:hypothetical protein